MKYLVVICIVLSLVALPAVVSAKADKAASVNMLNSLVGADGGRNLINIVIVLTVLAFAPAILLLMSSFTRIVIVLSFLRQAMGIQQLPPNQVVVGLSLFLTLFVMAPTYDRVNEAALKPYLANKIGFEEFMDKSTRELGTFMLKYTKEKDLALFMNIAKLKRPEGPKDLPLRVIVPAFAISELKRAFQIGFLLYIPFLMIDMVVASVLLSAGMMMLPPIFISLPFKVMLFVLVDGWNLLVGSIIKGFQ
ncbi:MAG: flagellar type III secretion system pore protein FliP [Syntrophorhabdaceae bacterium]|nr:flagellar type III secretion system pore protein FliP [Syntrophorhabdaceae bacterium]